MLEAQIAVRTPITGLVKFNDMGSDKTGQIKTSTKRIIFQIFESWTSTHRWKALTQASSPVMVFWGCSTVQPVSQRVQKLCVR